MAKQVSASNAVVSSCEEAAIIFGVPTYRMNSRVFTVVGAGGRSRPMFVGKWKDRYGDEHNGGMADLLLTPTVRVASLFPAISGWMGMSAASELLITVPLWCECKYGSGRLEPEQKLFREDVLARGAFYLEIHDGPDQLLEWFKEKGVRR